MNKQITISCTKMMLVLTEAELISGLRPEILEKGIRQGKGYRRAAACEKRQEQVDRWRLYEWLKGNHIPENAASLVETMSIKELREGCIEYLLSLLHK